MALNPLTIDSIFSDETKRYCQMFILKRAYQSKSIAGLQKTLGGGVLS